MDIPTLEELRRDPAKAENLLWALRHANDGWAISVWKDGGWCVWKPLDAKYAEAADEDYLVTIPLTELATVTPQSAD